MQGFVQNIEQLTLRNTNFRQVVYTAKKSQLVVMSLLPNQEIGLETHRDNDQFLRCEKGKGKCTIDGREHVISEGFGIVVPAGTEHNIVNTSSTEPLKLYTIYSPAHHREGTIHATKEEADAEE